MSGLLDLLTQQMGGDMAGALASQLGGDRDGTSKAITAALPALLGALSRNAADPRGAEALSSALQRDHDGSVLDDVQGYLGRANTADGDGILKHVLGERRGAVEANLSRSSGLDASQITKLLPLLAPIVMGALGKQQRQTGMDAGALAGMLAGESSSLEKSAPGLLGKLLDSDGDGDVMDDVLKIGGSVLGGLFKSR